MALSDRAKAGLTAFIRRVVGNDIVGCNVDRLAMYACKVIAQNADGTLELRPDDTRLSPYSNVPIRYGVPGVTATVPAGARCLITWAGADPQKPIVVAWEPGTVLGLVFAGGANGVARNGDSVQVTINAGSLGNIPAGGTPYPTANKTANGTITSASVTVKAG